jgi:DNA polymerase-3 subunit gamma/tau
MAPKMAPEPVPVAAAPPPSAPEPVAAPAAPAEEPAGGSGLTLIDVRRLWPSVIDRVKSVKRVTWIHLTQNSQVVGFNGKVLSLGFQSDGPRRSFESGGHAEIVQQAVIDEIGADVRIEAIVDPAADPNARTPEPAAPAAPAAPAPAAPEADAGGWPAVTAPPQAAAPAAPAAAPAPAPAAPTDDPPPWATEPPPADGPPEPEPDPEPGARRQMIADFQARAGAAVDAPPEDPDAAVDFNDREVDAESSAELLARELGAQLIEETPRGD